MRRPQIGGPVGFSNRGPLLSHLEAWPCEPLLQQYLACFSCLGGSPRAMHASYAHPTPQKPVDPRPQERHHASQERASQERSSERTTGRSIRLNACAGTPGLEKQIIHFHAYPCRRMLEPHKSSVRGLARGLVLRAGIEGFGSCGVRCSEQCTVSMNHYVTYLLSTADKNGKTCVRHTIGTRGFSRGHVTMFVIFCHISLYPLYIYIFDLSRSTEFILLILTTNTTGLKRSSSALFLYCLIRRAVALIATISPPQCFQEIKSNQIQCAI